MTHIKRFVVVAFALACLVGASFAQEQPDTATSPHIPTDPAPTTTNASEEELSVILDGVRRHEAGALQRYRLWRKAGGDGVVGAFGKRAGEADRECLESLNAVAALVDEAEGLAGSALSNPEYDRTVFHRLIGEAVGLDQQKHSLAAEAVEAIGKAWKDADALVKIRDRLFDQYQEEARRGKVADGTKLAWSLIRIGAAGPHVRIKPGSFVFDDKQASIVLSYNDAAVVMTIAGDDYRKRVRATVDGYNFRTGWAVLFQKPIVWMAAMAAAMREAGVTPDYMGEWDVMEAPEGLVALGATSGKRWDVPTRAFYRGALRPVELIPPSEIPTAMLEQFRKAAEKLVDGVMNDGTIPMPLRQALKPVLEGTYKPVDLRDYFDGEFCRRLIEADYLESQVPGLSEERKRELAEYREMLAKIELGLDRFAVDLSAEGRLVAVSRPDMDAVDGGEDAGEYRDPESGETVAKYYWRWERDDETVFHSPLPARYLYADSLLEHYDGKHAAKPVGAPKLTEVWHATLGRLASYRDGDEKAVGDAEKWREAVVLDARGRKDSTSGPLGWNFPLFVPVRDDQGDPVLIATVNGVVKSPDFSAIADDASRRNAQDAWLDGAARTLAEPGELALLYQIFFRYCSDSPLPEQPNLIGSHYALSDTHQTVYQSLERRWVGRLIGDCDDLAEFFQNLCDRQGKLSHVMQLPAHAAAGYLDEADEGGYEFIVLQTGPVLRFVDDTRAGAVEKAYRHFDESEGSHFTAAAVPLLLRFGGEDTRTAFVLPARIYWDRDYAEKMIDVQAYWHLHTFTAGIATMEGIVETDREAGNLKELASLYERVGEYGKSDELRREEYEAVGGDELAALSTLLDLAQLHIKGRDKAGALGDLEAMEEMFRDWRKTDSDLYERTAPFRYSWAALLSRLSEPERAWRVVRYDVEKAVGDGVPFSDSLLRTLVTLYNRMSIQRDDAGVEEPSRESVRIRYALRSVLAGAFGEGYFKSDDSNNKLHSRYFWLGRYAVAVAGRRAGLESLWRDGPYPAGAREHAGRKEDLSEADWEWFRIMPRLYLAYGAEMLDREEYPELYDPESARKCLELVERAMRKGEGFGSDVMGRDSLVKSELMLAFLRNDLDAFKAVMTQVRGRDYSSLYDDAATVFGAYCGLVPSAEFAPWIEAFHEFFPGRQNYFKAAYRAMDKEHYTHAVMLARATARFFPDDPLLVGEADGLERAVERLQRDKRERGWVDRQWAKRRAGPDPAASWLRDMVEPVY